MSRHSKLLLLFVTTALVISSAGCEEGPFLVTAPTGSTIATLLISPPSLTLEDSQVAGVRQEDNWDVLKPEAHTESMCLYLGLPRVVV